MAKDKKKKRNKLKTFLSLAAIFIACFLIYAASSDLMMTMKLKDEITSSEEMINSLENQKDDLSKEKDVYKRQDLTLGKLDTERGDVVIRGVIEALSYVSNKKGNGKESVISKIFK